MHKVTANVVVEIYDDQTKTSKTYKSSSGATFSPIAYEQDVANLINMIGRSIISQAITDKDRYFMAQDANEVE